MSDTILVIGGGPAGLEASRGVAELGYKAILVEKNSFLGGMPIEAEYAALTPDFRDAEEAMNTMINPVLEEPNIEVFLNSTVGSIDGEPGNFTFEIINADGSTKTEHAGAVIVATGFKHFDPAGASQHWGYYEYDDVLTLADCAVLTSSTSSHSLQILKCLFFIFIFPDLVNSTCGSFTLLVESLLQVPHNEVFLFLGLYLMINTPSQLLQV